MSESTTLTSMNSTTGDHDSEIREKLKSRVYSTNYIPSVLFMKFEAVYVQENPNVLDSLKRINGSVPVLTSKLKATGYGDWQSRVRIVPIRYFESRESFEELSIPKEYREGGDPNYVLDKISLKEALSILNVDLSCNMDYYLANKNELEKDLDRNITPDIDLSNERTVKKLEQELFYNYMCKLFGTRSEDDEVKVDGEKILYEKSFMIKDFYVVSNDGNSMYAFAERENFYLELSMGC